jgi:hypothetical protein
MLDRVIRDNTFCWNWLIHQLCFQRSVRCCTATSQILADTSQPASVASHSGQIHARISSTEMYCSNKPLHWSLIPWLTCSSYLICLTICIHKIFIFTFHFQYRDRSVGIVTGWTAGIRFLAEARLFSPPERPWGPLSFLTKGQQEFASPGISQQGLEADHSPCSAEVKKCESITSHPTHPHGMVFDTMTALPLLSIFMGEKIYLWTHLKSKNKSDFTTPTRLSVNLPSSGTKH